MSNGDKKRKRYIAEEKEGTPDTGDPENPTNSYRQEMPAEKSDPLAVDPEIPTNSSRKGALSDSSISETDENVNIVVVINISYKKAGTEQLANVSSPDATSDNGFAHVLAKKRHRQTVRRNAEHV